MSERKSNRKKEQVVSHEEAYAHSKEYFDGDELAANVWLQKYALRDSAGKIYERSPDDMHWRLAHEIARIESQYPHAMPAKEIYQLLKDFRYIIPQGGPMSGIGNDFQISSLSNCFVIGNFADSYGGIIQMDEEQAQLMKRRGGVGHDLSHIRPKTSPVMNSALSSTGLVPFMERYSNCTREVAQGGRRGALMLTISIKHPDAEEFIDAKLEQNKVTGANISVRIDDEFMQAVMNDDMYMQQFPIEGKPTVRKEIRALDLWSKIIHNAWKSAEPGVLFWDTVLRESIPDCYADMGYRTISTNPCGEIPLCPYDSCRLLAINLFSYVSDPFTDQASFDFELFRDHVKKAQRLMDDIIDLEIEKIDKILAKIGSDPEADMVKETEERMWKQIRSKCVEGRRMGLGVTGMGDMIAALGMQYGSDKANELAEEVQKNLAVSAYRGSVELARERGAFPIYDAKREQDNPFVDRLRKADPKLYEDMKILGRRNIALLTIAPTGTTSLMSQTTSGIEPVFQISYKRRRKVNPGDKNVVVTFVDQSGDSWEEYHVFHHKFVDWLQSAGYKEEEVRLLPQDKLDAIIEKSPYKEATANEIDWTQKVKMQGALQRWVDHSISVTVNIPENITEETVDTIYKTAWEAGCKGMTVYREGSRSGVLVKDDAATTKEADQKIRENHSPKRPKRLDAEVVRFRNDKEKWIAVVGLLHGKPYEIFTGKAEDTFVIPEYVTTGWVIKVKNGDGKNRYDFQYLDKDGYRVTHEGLSRSFDKEFWNYAKLISGVLRHGMPLPYAVNLVANLNLGNAHINSWANGVVRALKKFIPDGTAAVKSVCDSCGESDNLVYQEGCLICMNCGSSRC